MTTLLLISCEGVVGGDGYIIDSESKQPIEGVEVILYLNEYPEDTSISNKEGYFTGSQFVGCIPCPDAKISLSNKDYKTVTIDFNKFWELNKYNTQLRKDSLTIEMEKN